MNRSFLKRSFAIILLASLALIGVSVSVGQAQSNGKTVKKAAPALMKQPIGPAGIVVNKTPSRDILKKYDLAVKVTGTIDGNKDYLLTFTITNVGQEAYRGGRYVLLLSVSADKKKTVMQRREPIKQLLMPGESWTPPFGFKVLSRAVPTNHFVAVLTEAGPRNDEDANIRNDWDQIEVVAPVR